MQFDPNNKVVQLCVQGMGLEAEGKIELAKEMFQQAWDIAENDFEAFTAAHYLARNQEDPNENLKWNLTALDKALAIENDDMKAHYPSLYLNIARSYENLNLTSEARRYYRLAADNAEFLPPGQYGDMIRSGIGAGLQRTTAVSHNNRLIEGLINSWCERKDLKPLSFILPAYVGNLGTEADVNKLISSLSYLSAVRCLPPEEQQKIDDLINEMSAKF